MHKSTQDFARRAETEKRTLLKLSKERRAFREAHWAAACATSSRLFVCIYSFTSWIRTIMAAPAPTTTCTTFRVTAPTLSPDEGVSIVLAGEFQLPMALVQSEAHPGLFFTARPLRMAPGATSYRYLVTAADGRVQVRRRRALQLNEASAQIARPQCARDP